MIETTATQRIAQYVAALPEKQLKAAMLVWLTHDNASIDDLAETLAQEQATVEDIDALYETPEARKLFPAMTEEEMLAGSIEAYEEYKRTGIAYTQDQMEAWAKDLRANPRLAS
jgi:hypothetical protein